MRSAVLVVIAAAVVGTLHFSSLPRTLWEFDEHFFALGVENYQPLLHHPPPPGCPLFIGVAKIFFTNDPFRALVTTNVVMLFVGLVAWAWAFREISGSVLTGVVAAVLLYGSPALLMSGTTALADTGMLALLGLAVFCGTAGFSPLKSTIAGGLKSASPLFVALAVGWRPQIAVAAIGFLLALIALARTWRERITITFTFTLACLAWLIPLVIETGGPASFWNWLSGQAAYYAQHDADLSRSGHSAAHILLRFVAHPWGPKWLSIPLLGCALLGIRRNPKLIPLAAMALAYLAFALATMDPADAVRYAIPSLPLIALLAATALTRVQFLAVLALFYAAGAWWYASPVLRTRATEPSPGVLAARWIRANMPPNTVVMYELPLRPHAEFHLRDFRNMRVDAALAQFGGDAAVPMVLFADGETGSAAGVTFRWPDTDAYRKLTRQHYGAVSVIPLLPSQRFRVVEGVYAPERRRDGAAWRWLGARAVLELPDIGASAVRLQFRTPPEYPLASNRVRVRIGNAEAVVALGRTETADVVLPRSAQRIEIFPERTFVPAEIPGANNRDRRTLSVMLTAVEQTDMMPRPNLQ